MITEHDLQEAIAECQGKRNPDANTCIKLAAYFTILKTMYPKEQLPPEYLQLSSGAASPAIEYDSGTEFSNAVKGRTADEIMPVMDELMTAVKVLHPRLYNGVMDKL